MRVAFRSAKVAWDKLPACQETILGIARNDGLRSCRCETGIIANANQIDFGDFNRDGDLDIVAGYRAGKLVVFRNSDGAFDGGTVVFEDKRHPWTQRLYWRDLDRDGQSGLFCATGPWGGKLGRSLQLVTQTDRAKMKIVWQSSTQTAYRGFEFNGVNHDGDMDVISADYGRGGIVAVYLSKGGKLADKPAWSVKTSGPAHEAVLGDIDQDGDLDLAVGCQDQAHIYENLTSKTPKQE